MLCLFFSPRLWLQYTSVIFEIVDFNHLSRLTNNSNNWFQHVPTNCTDGAPGWATCGLVTGAGSSMWALLGHGPGNSVCCKMGTSETAILGKIRIKFWGLPSETHQSGETQDVLTVLSTSGFDPIETHPLKISTGTVGLFVQTFCLAGHKGPSKGFFPILLHLCRRN